MKTKDILISYLLMAIVITFNVIGALVYVKYLTQIPGYFMFTLGLTGIFIVISQLIIITSFIYRAFKDYFKWD